MLTNGWLKPNKFKEISGVPALQLLTKKLESERKEQKYFDVRAKTAGRPNSRTLRIKIKGTSDHVELEAFPDWKSYFNSEEVRQAQHNIQLGIESPVASSSSENSIFEEILDDRPFSPAVEDISF